MFNTHLGHQREKIVAVAAVGGGSAAVAIIGFQAGAPARVIAAERSVLPLEDRSDGATVAGVSAQLSAAGEKVQKTYAQVIQKGGSPVGELFIVLHAPWARSRTARTSVSFEDDTLITDRVIAEAAGRVLAEQPDLDKKNLFEAQVTRTELNGYPCAKPRGKRATGLHVFTLLSESAAGVPLEIASSLQKVFPHLAPTFRSATRAAMTVLREVPSMEKDYLVIDMASEGTILTAVRDGVAAEHELIPEGMRTIVKRIAGSGMPEETLSLMRMLARDECADPACDSIRASVTRVEPELVRIFGEAMVKCTAERRLPNTLVLFAHPDISPWLSKFFSRIDFAQFTLTTQPYSVRTLLMTDLAHLVRPEEGVVLDAGLALVCALVNIEKSRPKIS